MLRPRREGGHLRHNLVFLFIFLFASLAAARETSPCERYLQTRYGVAPQETLLTPNTKTPVILRMQDHGSLVPRAPAHTAVTEIKSRDAVIVGGGPSGLTAALYLAEAGKSVLILERNEEMGGLGMGSELAGVQAGGGAAYSAGPKTDVEREIFKKIGLGDYEKKIAIEEPIDSYLWNGKLYLGIWEDHTLAQLPASFALFKYALVKLSDDGAGDTEGPLAHWADKQNMAQLVRGLPKLMKTWKTAEADHLLKQLSSDKRLNPADPMKDVIDLLDLYGRSALGGTADLVSARQFIDFYVSELTTRYTGSLGTGTISKALIEKLKAFGDRVEFKTLAPVSKIKNLDKGARVEYVENGALKAVRADNVIFAAPMSVANRVIEDIEKLDAEKSKLIQNIQMTDYAVHIVRVKGHPYRATYDTWVYSSGDQSKASDYILGRWQDPKIGSYLGMRDFEKEPSDDYGVITIYQPLGATDAANFDQERWLKMTEAAVEDMKVKLQPLAQGKIEVELVESFRWPHAIHIVHPGYLDQIPVLERPIGAIQFVNSTIGAPELESSMGRAALVAKDILGRAGLRDLSAAGLHNSN